MCILLDSYNIKYESYYSASIRYVNINNETKCEEFIKRAKKHKIRIQSVKGDEVLERLSLAVENLTEYLRPELKKTATLERKKQEAKEIEIAAAKAVKKWKGNK